MEDKVCKICGGWGYLPYASFISPTKVTLCTYCTQKIMDEQSNKFKAEFEKQLKPPMTMNYQEIEKLFEAAKINKDVAAKLKEAAVAAHYFDLANELREIERSIPENPNDKEKKDERDTDKVNLTAQKARAQVEAARFTATEEILQKISDFSEFGHTDIKWQFLTQDQITKLLELGFKVKRDWFIFGPNNTYIISW